VDRFPVIDYGIHHTRAHIGVYWRTSQLASCPDYLALARGAELALELRAVLAFLPLKASKATFFVNVQMSHGVGLRNVRRTVRVVLVLSSCQCSVLVLSTF
jgi:hypothetical protein